MKLRFRFTLFYKNNIFYQNYLLLSILSPLNYLDTFVTCLSIMYIWVYFRSLYSVSFIYMFTLITILYDLNHCSFIRSINWGSIHLFFSSFKTLLPRHLRFTYKIWNQLVDFYKENARIFIWIAFKLLINWERIGILTLLNLFVH